MQTINATTPEMTNRFVARSRDGEPVFDGISFTGRTPHRRVFLCMAEAIQQLDLAGMGKSGRQLTAELPHYVGFNMTVASEDLPVAWARIKGHYAPSVPVVLIEDRLPEEMRTCELTLVFRRNRAAKLEVIDGWCGGHQPPLPISGEEQSRIEFWKNHAIAFTTGGREFEILEYVDRPAWA